MNGYLSVMPQLFHYATPTTYILLNHEFYCSNKDITIFADMFESHLINIDTYTYVTMPELSINPYIKIN